MTPRAGAVEPAVAPSDPGARAELPRGPARSPSPAHHLAGQPEGAAAVGTAASLDAWEAWGPTHGARNEGQWWLQRAGHTRQAGGCCSGGNFNRIPFEGYSLWNKDHVGADGAHVPSPCAPLTSHHPAEEARLPVPRSGNSGSRGPAISGQLSFQPTKRRPRLQDNVGQHGEASECSGPLRATGRSECSCGWGWFLGARGEMSPPEAAARGWSGIWVIALPSHLCWRGPERRGTFP